MAAAIQKIPGEMTEPTEPIETRPEPTLPNPNVDISTGRRPSYRWNVVERPVRGPVTYDYDIFDWLMRAAFFVGGLGLGWLIFAHH
jgi:hypothetical protein